MLRLRPAKEYTLVIGRIPNGLQDILQKKSAFYNFDIDYIKKLIKVCSKCFTYCSRLFHIHPREYKDAEKIEIFQKKMQ